MSVPVAALNNLYPQLGDLVEERAAIREKGDKARFSTDPNVCRQIYDGQFLFCKDEEEKDWWDIGHVNMRELQLLRAIIDGEDSPALYLFEGNWQDYQFAAYQFESELDARAYFELRKEDFQREYKGE